MQHNTSDNAISIEQLYQHILGRQVLTDINLEIQANGWLLLYGPNGAGKTMLCRILMALDQPSAGKVRVAGLDFSLLNSTTLTKLRAQVGAVLQRTSLLSELSVLENIILPLRNQPLTRNQIAREARLIVTLLQLDGMEDLFPSELSLGQRRLVELARALIRKPAILLWDGLADGLGDSMTRTTLSVLHEIRQNRGLALLATDNNTHAMQGYQHELAILDAGTILFHGASEDLAQARQRDPQLALAVGDPT